jgi:hypothetical protein
MVGFILKNYNVCRLVDGDDFCIISLLIFIASCMLSSVYEIVHWPIGGTYYKEIKVQILWTPCLSFAPVKK